MIIAPALAGEGTLNGLRGECRPYGSNADTLKAVGKCFSDIVCENMILNMQQFP